MTPQDFLKTFDFQASEIQEYERAFQRYLAVLQIDDRRLSDVHVRLSACFDLSLRSVKGILKLLLIEMLQELRENGAQPRPKLEVAVPAPVAYALLLQEIAPDYQISFREYLFYFLSTFIFGANQVFLEHAQGRVRLCQVCGLIAMRRSGLWYELAQKPEAMLTVMPFCDEAAKVGEEFGVKDSIKRFHISPSDFIAYAAQALRETASDLAGSRTNSDDRLAATLQRNARQYALVSARLLALFKLVNGHRHMVPVGNNELSLACALGLVAFDGWYEQSMELLGLMLRELRLRIADGASVISPKGIRVGCSYLSFTNPALDRAFLRNDVAVTVNELLCPTIQVRQSRTEPFERLSQFWVSQAGFLPPRKRVDQISRMRKTYRLDSVLFGQFATDMRLGGNQPMLYALAEAQGLPCHYFSLDCWEIAERDYDNYIEEKAYFIRKTAARSAC